jgi:hypothetical protein
MVDDDTKTMRAVAIRVDSRSTTNATRRSACDGIRTCTSSAAALETA